jgi:hypothetical protein
MTGGFFDRMQKALTGITERCNNPSDMSLSSLQQLLLSVNSVSATVNVEIEKTRYKVTLDQFYLAGLALHPLSSRKP